ncbi:hypothetical protein D3C79_391390 [compost metagenome]|jgi:hypothetical protein
MILIVSFKNYLLNWSKLGLNLVKSHKVNLVSEMQYDISNESAFQLLNRANGMLKEIESLFKKDII